MELCMKHEEEFTILRNLINRQISGLERGEICADLGLSTSSFYRRMTQLRDMPVASSIKGKRRGPKLGSKRTSELQEKLMEEFIYQDHLTKQKPRISKSYFRLVEKFDRAKVEVPSIRTFRRRLKLITKSTEQNGRLYASERQSKHSSKTKHYKSTAPMAIVQIDHTKLNAILISSVDGKVLGRAVFTMVTDIYTRMVIGIYVGIHGPDYESVSNALAHTCYDKTEYLQKLGIIGEWPTLGIPEVLHMDNAKEFKSKALIHGCGEYGIERKYRPIATPHYGGHCESLIKTINESLRNIQGATFQDWKERGDYPSEKLACFTLPMVEKHIVNFIVNFYHKREHSRLGISPIQKYQHAVTQGFKPRFSPTPKGIFISDFSETHIRNVRNLGIEFECKEYWSPYLASLYDQNISEVRVIPISETVKFINVLGPDKKLHKVPAKNLGLPDITRREWKRYRRIVQERNQSLKMTNREIAEYIRQENKIDREAKRQSLRLRKAVESQFLSDTSYDSETSIKVTNDNANTPIIFDPQSAFYTSSTGEAYDG